MARIPTVSPEETSEEQKPFLEAVKSQYGGIVPGILQILLVDPKVSEATLGIYQHLHLRADSPMTRLQREMLATVVNGAVSGAPWLGLHKAAVRRLTGNERLSVEFATSWPEFDLDAKTRSLLTYAQKLTEQPGAVDDADIEALRNAGWDENGIWEATALISFFNFSGRMEAASGLGEDEIPEGAEFAEATGEGGAK